MRRALALLALSLLSGLAQAHLMVAQHATLNFSGSGAYLVAALPVSAFEGVDDDGDGLLSLTELRAHAPALEAQLRAGLQLRDAQGARPLQGLMLSLAPADGAAQDRARHLVVLGRYELGAAPEPPLHLHLTLFGRAVDERQQNVTVTRAGASQWLRLTPEHSVRALFPGRAGAGGAGRR